MLSPIFGLLKLALKILLFSLVVLTLGNIFGWSGRTVSDRIRTQLSAAERKIDHATDEAKSWVAEKGREMLPDVSKIDPRKAAEEEMAEDARDGEKKAEKIPPSERQKLRNLIRELNGTQKRD